MTEPDKPSGDPFRDMCMMLGVMTIAWAWAENVLAIIVEIVNDASANPVEHKHLPVSLIRKLDFLRISLRDIPSLELFKDRGKALIKLFVDLKGRRNDFTHGAAWLMPENVYQSVLPFIKGRKGAIKKKGVNVAGAVSLNREIKALAESATAFLVDIGRAFAVRGE